VRDQIFWQTFTITVLQFDLEWSKFAPGTQVRRSIFPGGQPRPYSKGRGHLCSPDFVGTPYRCLNRLTYCDEIWCGYTWGAACFYGSATPRPKGRVPATQILLWSFYVRWIRATKFGTGARGHGHVSCGQPRPHFKRDGPQRSPILGPMCAHTVKWETTTELCMVIKHDVRQILRGRSQMLACNPFASDPHHR